MDKILLQRIETLHKELADLEKRLKNIEKKEKQILTDSVTGSSSEFPYTTHSIKIEGVKYFKPKYSKATYRKQIRSKRHKLEKLIKQLEYELNYIADEDSEIRRIIRYKYEDNLNWIQIMFEMEYKSEDTARKKLDRFLKKF